MKLLLAYLLVGAAACSSSSPEPGSPLITYSTSGGIDGRGDHITLVIEDTGRAVRTKTETKTINLDDNAVDYFQDLVDASNFPALTPTYAAISPIGDGLQFDLTVQLDQEYKVSVQEDVDASGRLVPALTAPEPLRQLVADLLKLSAPSAP